MSELSHIYIQRCIDERQQQRDEIKSKLFKELEIEDHPKREKLFELAWEYGHSAGYQEILNYGYDLVELIK